MNLGPPLLVVVLLERGTTPAPLLLSPVLMGLPGSTGRMQGALRRAARLLLLLLPRAVGLAAAAALRLQPEVLAQPWRPDWPRSILLRSRISQVL